MHTCKTSCTENKTQDGIAKTAAVMQLKKQLHQVLHPICQKTEVAGDAALLFKLGF